MLIGKKAPNLKNNFLISTITDLKYKTILITTLKKNYFLYLSFKFLKSENKSCKQLAALFPSFLPVPLRSVGPLCSASSLTL